VIVPKRMIAGVEKSVRAVHCDRPNVWDGFTGFGFVVAGGFATTSDVVCGLSSWGENSRRMTSAPAYAGEPLALIGVPGLSGFPVPEGDRPLIPHWLD
jgi:hypothetical protein